MGIQINRAPSVSPRMPSFSWEDKLQVTSNTKALGHRSWVIDTASEQRGCLVLSYTFTRLQTQIPLL